MAMLRRFGKTKCTNYTSNIYNCWQGAVELSAGKPERNRQETWGQAERLAGKPECDSKRSEDEERARKRAIQKRRSAAGHGTALPRNSPLS